MITDELRRYKNVKYLIDQQTAGCGMARQYGIIRTANTSCLLDA